MRQLPEPLTGVLEREHQTITAMVRLWCRDHHKSGDDLCSECREFLDFAAFRLHKCPYGTAKPTCSLCPIHCYKPAMRDNAKVIMRYAGPRMLFRHPLMTLRHLLHKRRAVPPLPSKHKPKR